MSPFTYKLPDNLDQEINELEESIERFKKGEITPTEMKVKRVPFGIYEQRKKNTYMVRIRCGGAIVTPEQLERIAQISRMHASNYIHLTTRQEIQLHYVLIDSIIPVIRELKTVGLSSRGGGGNTVRNIMSQEDAGIAKDEAFDVSPYATDLTSRLIAEADSWNLPRKFKIAFSGSPEDRGYATIADVGYIARIKDGKKGFKVYFAGGMGAKTQVSPLLFDFIPDGEVYNVAKAVKNIFYKNGNRKNKHAARLRFLVKTLGEEELKRITLEEYDAVRKENYPPLVTQEVENVAVDPQLPLEPVQDKGDFALWQKRFAIAQKQDGLYAVILPAHLGHVDNDKAIALAHFLKPFGENTIRMRKDQNILLRNIPQKYLPNLYNFLKKTFDHFNRPFIVDKVIACAGASTCQLGICLSPGAATETKRRLEKFDLNLDDVRDAVINISGCPNSCGQHHVADLGFFGKVSRKGDKVYPSFNVVAGTQVHDGETEFAQKVAEIAAKDLPNVVQDTLRGYLTNKDGFGNFREFMRSEKGKETLNEICAKYKEIPEYNENSSYYFDWGTDKIFSVADRGKGECSAGIFDLIESDFGHVQQAKKLLEEIAKNGGSREQKQQLLKDLIYYSSRVLLVTRGLEPKSEQEALNYFREHFFHTGLVDTAFDELIKIAESKDYSPLLKKESEAYAFSDRIKLLYDCMDSAFNFKLPDGEVKAPVQQVTPTPAAAGAQEEESADEEPQGVAVTADVVKDFRGVGCPMNFVKTKMELSKMKPQDILEVWLDDGEPIENVPASVKEEGHKVLEQKKTEDYWTVLIEKV